MKKLIVFMITVLLSSGAFALEGYDSGSGDEVRIRGSLDDLGQEGRLDFYDTSDGTYHTGIVNKPYDGEGPVDVYDTDTGNTRNLETD